MTAILVTGAGGGLGSNVVEAARAGGIEVRALVRSRARAPDVAGVQWLEGDARDVGTLERAARGCDALFHMVNVNFADDWIATTAALLEAALAACARTGARLVFPANVWVFGRGRRGERVAEGHPHAPCSRKGRARQRNEERIQASGARFVMLRLPEFYGPHVGTLTGPPLQRIAQGGRATWFGPDDVEVEFVYMPDAARALLAVGLADGVDGEVFHLPGHLPGSAAITPRAFLEVAREVAGGGELRFVPAAFVRAASLVSAQARQFADILHLWTHPVLLAGSKLAARFPELRTTSYRDGIAATIAWHRAHPDARMHY